MLLMFAAVTGGDAHGPVLTPDATDFLSALEQKHQQGLTQDALREAEDNMRATKTPEVPHTKEQAPEERQ